MKQYLLTALGASLLSTTLLSNASALIQEVKSTQELESLLKREQNLVIKFSTEQCKYCIYLDPFFKKAVNAYQQALIQTPHEEVHDEETHTIEYPRITFASVMIPSDVPTRDWYKKRFEFATVPTVVYYRDGQKKFVHGSNNATITDKDILNTIATVYRI